MVPLTAREEASPSPQPAVSPSPSPVPQIRPSPAPQPEKPSAETLQAQQEAFRAMLRPSAPEQGQGQGHDDGEDPTIRLLNSLLGAIPGDANAPPFSSGAAGDAGGAGGMPGQSPGMSPAAIASALGVPPFIANMLGGAAQPSEEEQKRIQIWKTLHILFALGVAVYLLLTINSSVTLFGSPPPKPATVQNPFLIFVTGEILLTSGRILMSGGQSGLGMAVKAVKDIVRDGSLVIFALGLGSWYYGEWQTGN